MSLAWPATLDDWVDRRAASEAVRGLDAWSPRPGRRPRPLRDRLRDLWSEARPQGSARTPAQAGAEADPENCASTALLLLGAHLTDAGDRDAAAGLLLRARQSSRRCLGRL